jgi:hypothetical protein
MFVVTRSGDLDPAVQVDFATRDGTAHAGTDFTATSGTLFFAPGQITATISVPIIGNTLFEPDRTFRVVLSNPLAPASTASFADQQTFVTGNQPTGVAVADFNGDKKPDLAVSNFNAHNVSVLLNTTAAGATTPSFADQRGFGDFIEAAGVAVADFNGDGRPDLAVTDQYSDQLYALLNTTPHGASTPSFGEQVGFLAGRAPASLAVGDFNGDGKPDLVVATNGHYGGTTVTVLLNTTAPGANDPSFSAQSFATGNTPVGVAVGDFNGDGKPDLAVTNIRDNTVSVLLNQTPPGASVLTFAAAQPFATGTSPVGVAVGDFNGDGKPDLAVTNAGDDTVSVLLNTTEPGAETPSFAAAQPFATGRGAVAVVVADFNDDGRPDLAVTNDLDDTVSVLLNQTTRGASVPSFADQQLFATGGAPVAVTVGDFNRDGEPDLAVANEADNTVSVLLNTKVPITITLSGSPATGTIQDDDAPVSMAIVAGNNQSAVVNTAFATNLTVEVRNAAGSLVQGVSVTFTAPASGPSGTFRTKFGSSNSVVVVTDASGRAIAPAFTAEAIAGHYSVLARATGGSSPGKKFNLINTTGVAGVALSAPDPSNNVATNYTGTIHFTSADENNAAFDLTILWDRTAGRSAVPSPALRWSMARWSRRSLIRDVVTGLALDGDNNGTPGASF